MYAVRLLLQTMQQLHTWCLSHPFRVVRSCRKRCWNREQVSISHQSMQFQLNKMYSPHLFETPTDSQLLLSIQHFLPQKPFYLLSIVCLVQNIFLWRCKGEYSLVRNAFLLWNAFILTIHDFMLAFI